MKWRYQILKALAQRRNIYVIQKRCLALSYHIDYGNDPAQPPLLMIHGLLGNKNNFNTTRRLLREKLPNMTVISCDVRNHGRSPHSNTMDYQAMSQDCLELLESLNIDKCVLLGHSLGGRIAMYTALTERSKVDKLIVVDVAPGIERGRHGVGSDTIQYVEAMARVKFPSDVTRSQAKRDAAEQLIEAIPQENIREFVLTNLTKTASGSFGWRANVDVFLQNMELIGRLQNKDVLTPYNGDTLFLCGGLSNYVSSDDIPDIKRWFPTAVIKYLPDCGHWVHSDKPQLFSENVAAFISGRTE